MPARRIVRNLLLVQIVLIAVSLAAPVAAQHEHHAPTQPGASAQDTAHDHSALKSELARQEEQARRFSEWNHRLTGLALACAALLVFFEPRLRRRWPVFRGIWALFLLAPGAYLLVASDPELWPLGSAAWLDTVRADRAVAEHKVFALLLVVLGIVEWLRARGVWRAAGAAAIFPVLAAAGAFLLLFHYQGPGVSSDYAVQWARIRLQYLAAGSLGAGIAISKIGWELGHEQRRAYAYVWPVLMLALGLLLVAYRE